MSWPRPALGYSAWRAPALGGTPSRSTHARTPTSSRRCDPLVTWRPPACAALAPRPSLAGISGRLHHAREIDMDGVNVQGR